eukprot:5827225-Alexandrium_andersonii.AAC.1
MPPVRARPSSSGGSRNSRRTPCARWADPNRPAWTHEALARPIGPVPCLATAGETAHRARMSALMR